MDFERSNNLLIKFGELVDIGSCEIWHVVVSLLGWKGLIVLNVESHRGELVSDTLVVEFSLRVFRSELIDLLLVHLQLLVGLVRGREHDRASGFWTSLLTAFLGALTRSSAFTIGIQGPDLDVDKAFGAQATHEFGQSQLLEVFVRLSVIRQINISSSEHSIVGKIGEELGFLWLILLRALVVFDEGLHVDFLVELSKSTLINSSGLSFELICSSLEHKIAVFALAFTWAVDQHQRLEVDEVLKACVGHF